MSARRLAPVLLALAFAGCGADDLPGGANPPSEGALVADSLEALEQLQDGSARFELKLDAKPQLSGPAALLVGDEISLEIEGAASGDALVASGKGTAANQSFEGEIRAGDGFYLRVDDTWYGSPESGTDSGGAGFESPPEPERTRTLAALRAAGDDLFDGDVEGGPEIGGDSTWQISGTINPDAAIEIARQTGRPLTPDEQASLRRNAKRVKIEYAVGRDDHLPRRIAIDGALTKAELADVAGELPLEGLELSFELKLSDWGAPVEFEAPANYTSFEQLLGSFFAGSGLDVEIGGAPAPAPGGPPSAGPPPEIPAPSIPEPTPAPPPPAAQAPAPPAAPAPPPGVPAPPAVPAPPQ